MSGEGRSQTATALNRPTDALFHLGILNDQAGGKDAEILKAMGDHEGHRGDWKKAANWYADAVAVDPKRIGSYFAQANLLRKRLEQPDEAEKVIARMLQANPNSPEAQVARIRFARDSGQRAGGMGDLRKLLDPLIERHGATYPDLFLLAANMDFESGATDSAKKLLQQGMNSIPTCLPSRATGPPGTAAGNRAEAAKLLLPIVEKLSSRVDDYRVTVELLIEAGEKEQARKLIAAIRRDEGTAGLVEYLEARVAYDEQRWLDAVRFLLRHDRIVTCRRN